MRVRRRDVLRLAATVAGTGLTARAEPDSPLTTPATTPFPGIVEIGGKKQLFFDDLLIASRTRTSKLMGQPDKYPENPVLRPDRPWESEHDDSGEVPVTGIQISGQTVIYDQEEQIFKMWYNPWAYFNKIYRPWCYAVSKDGYHWEKPNVGVYEYKGSRENNILGAYTKSKYFNVFKDPQDPDPKRRYKAMGEVENTSRNGAAVSFSPDGVRWTEWSGNPVVAKGRDIADCPTFLGWDSRLRKYVYYPRPGPPLANRINARGYYQAPDRVNVNDGQLRAIGYSTSDDFIHWSPTALMLAPDDLDRTDFQYYQITTAQVSDFYVGLLHMIQTHEETFDVYLLTSRDGFHWNWVSRELPFLRRGEVGSYDGGYLTPSGPVVHDGTIFIYYGAYSGAHSIEENKRGPNRMNIALAALPVDRYVGLLAGPDVATVITRPVMFTGSSLKIDMDPSLEKPNRDLNRRNFGDADLRVALTDQWGAKIEGFSIDDCTLLVDRGVQQVSWRGVDLKGLQGKPVRLHFEFRNAALYSFQFV